MATYPDSPMPRSVNLPSINDPLIESRFDNGAIATRTKYTKVRKSYVLLYIGRLDDYYTIADFVEYVRGRALTFDWVFPWPSSVVNATDATPIAISTYALHNLQTGNVVEVADVAPVANGQHIITRIGPTALTLDGTVGVVPSQTGTITRYFPKMRLLLGTNNTFPAPEKIEGPPSDNQGIWRWSVTLEEDF